ncbi:MAG TPA: AAA family ATPase, partial [Syntrophobacteraceae bacterium]|nr:AAA family ATPase [Syntrophobacteraceae bacterium]
MEKASEFVNRSLPDQDAVIGSGLLPADGTAFISSYSKLGKSIYATNMGIVIAAGKPFLNQFDVPKPRQVLYLQEEIGERSMQDRLRKQLTYAKSLGIDPGSNFELVNKSGIRLMTDEGLKTVMCLLRARRPEVVIWDCLYRFQSLNENKAE